MNMKKLMALATRKRDESDLRIKTARVEVRGVSRAKLLEVTERSVRISHEIRKAGIGPRVRSNQFAGWIS